MSSVYKRGRAQISANLTPMIDVTFLLIVFFVLVSQIVEVENVPLALPELDEPASQVAGEEQRIIVNVVPGIGGAAIGYKVSSTQFSADDDGLAGLRNHLAGVYVQTPAIGVNLRADRFTEYEHVEPALQAIGDAARMAGVTGAARVNLVVIREDAR